MQALSILLSTCHLLKVCKSPMYRREVFSSDTFHVLHVTTCIQSSCMQRSSTIYTNIIDIYEVFQCSDLTGKYMIFIEHWTGHNFNLIDGWKTCGLVVLATNSEYGFESVIIILHNPSKSYHNVVFVFIFQWKFSSVLSHLIILVICDQI